MFFRAAVSPVLRTDCLEFEWFVPLDGTDRSFLPYKGAIGTVLGLQRGGGLTPFRTAVPFWGRSTQILSSFFPKRDCGPIIKGLKSIRTPRQPMIYTKYIDIYQVYIYTWYGIPGTTLSLSIGAFCIEYWYGIPLCPLHRDLFY